VSLLFKVNGNNFRPKTSARLFSGTSPLFFLIFTKLTKALVLALGEVPNARCPARQWKGGEYVDENIAQ